MVYVYVLQSAKDGKLYTGCTHDLRERLRLHNSGKVQATRKRVPLQLIYYEASLKDRDAFHREKYLKTAYGKRYIKSRCLNYFMGQGFREPSHERICSVFKYSAPIIV